MEGTNTDPELEERSLTGDSSKDSRDGSSDGDFPCPEALQRATGQNPGVLVAGETPQGNICPRIGMTPEIWRCWQRGLPLWSCGGKEIIVGLLKSGLGRLDRRGTLPAANPRLKAARHRLCRSLVHLGSRAKVSARELLAVHLRTGRLRGPGVVGNLAMPKLLSRA
jgi:hypothetical protein